MTVVIVIVVISVSIAGIAAVIPILLAEDEVHRTKRVEIGVDVVNRTCDTSYQKITVVGDRVRRRSGRRQQKRRGLFEKNSCR